MITKFSVRCLAAASAVAALSLLGGCHDHKCGPETASEGPGCIDGDYIREHQTPELETVALSHEQRDNRTMHTFDYNLRELNDDLDEIFLFNRPMRMTFYPTP